MKRFLRIGDMARLTGVSIKALRFYDEQGLLRPDHVDPQTGYRHYTADQAALLALITNLRAVDFSIAEISAILKNAPVKADALLRAIEHKKDVLKAEQADLANKIETASMLAAIIHHDADNHLRLTSVPAQSVFAVRRRVAHLGAPVTEMFEQAEAEVAACSARADRPPFLIFHDPPTHRADLDVEVCIPVDDANTAMNAPGAPLALAAVYAGGYETTTALYRDMKTRIAEAGLSIAGPLREIYHRFGADQEDYSLPRKMLARGIAEFLTELQIPVSP